MRTDGNVQRGVSSRAAAIWALSTLDACVSSSSSGRTSRSIVQRRQAPSHTLAAVALFLLLFCAVRVIAIDPIPQAADILTVVNVDTPKDVRLDANLHIPDGGELLLSIQVPRTEIRVDAHGPAKVTRVYTSHTDGTWGVGEQIDLFVEFTSAVEVTGSPTLVLRTGCHSSACHTREVQRLRCQATGGKFSIGFADQVVHNIPWDANQRVLSDYLTRVTTLEHVVVDYSISDTACTFFGNNITITFETVNIDGRDGDLPAMTADRDNRGGDGNGLFHIRFKPPTMTPLADEIQKGARAPDRTAVFVGQPNVQTLQFKYTVQLGDASAHLDYTSSDSLDLPTGANVFNANTQQSVVANRKLPPPGATGDWERGIGSSVAATSALVIDGSPPVVVDVTSPHVDGTFGIGEVIPIHVVFSVPIVVSGSPTLVLETGLIDRIIPFHRVVDATVVEFLYVVQAKDTSPDLAYAGTTVLEVNGGTIKRASTTAATFAVLLLPENGERGSLAVNKNLVIDTTDPTVARVSAVSPNGVYTAGDTVEIAVQFDAPVVVVGMPLLLLRTGSVNLYPGAFVQAVPVLSAAQPSRTIQFPAVDHGLATATSKGLQVEISGQILTIDSVDGDFVTMTQVYTGAVVTPSIVADGGGPTISIRTPGRRAALYKRGSNSQTLVFQYIVQIGDVSLDLDYLSTTSLQLNGGSIKRLSTTPVTDADRLLPPPGTANSLSDSATIVVDTQAPRVLQVAAITRDDVYRAGDAIAFALVFDLPVVVLKTASVLMDVAPLERYAMFTGTGSGTTTLEFRFECDANDDAAVFDVADTTSLRSSLGAVMGDIRRSAMAPLLPAMLQLPPAGLSSKGIAIHQTCVRITSVTSSHEDGIVGAGETIELLVQFTASVDVDVTGGDPTLALTTDNVALYATGSGSSVVRFRYVVQRDDPQVRLNYADIYAFALNGGTIVASADQKRASTVLPDPAMSALVQQRAIDISTSPPIVKRVTTTALDRSYTVGDALTIAVTFSAAVDVADAAVAITGKPTLLLRVGTTNSVAAQYVASEDDTVYFSYAVVAGESTARLSYNSRVALTCVGSSGANQRPTQDATGARSAVLHTRVFVAWTEVAAVTATSQVRVQSFDAAAQFPPEWIPEDGGNDASSSIQFDASVDATAPAFAVVGGSKLYITWQEASSSTVNAPTQVRVAVYRSLVPRGAGVTNQWTFVDAALATSNGINRDPTQSATAPALVAHMSKLYAAWHEPSAAAPATAQIRVAALTGTDAAPVWTSVDGYNAAHGLNYASSNTAQNVQLASCASGTTAAVLFAAWEERALPIGVSQIRVAALTGTYALPKWVFVDGSAAVGINYNPAMAASAPSVACNGALLVVAWTEDALLTGGSIITRIRAKQFNRNDAAHPIWLSLDRSVGLNFDHLQSAHNVRLTTQVIGASNALFATWEETSAATSTMQVRVAGLRGSVDAPVWTFLDDARSISALNHDVSQSASRPIVIASPLSATFTLFALWHERLVVSNKAHVRGAALHATSMQWQSLHDACIRRQSTAPTTVANLLLPALDAPGALNFGRAIRIDTSSPIVQSVRLSGDVAHIVSTALAVQTVDVFNQASVTHGAFQLVYGNSNAFTTRCIDWNAPATGVDSLQAALETIQGLALRVNVVKDVRAFHDGDRYTITFQFPTMGLQSLRVVDAATSTCAAFVCLSTATQTCAVRNLVRANVNADVSLRPGVVDVLVQFSSPVVVASGTPTPTLTLETGAVDAIASYTTRSVLQAFDVGTDAPSVIVRGSFRLSYGDFAGGGGSGVGTIRTTACIDVPLNDDDGVQELAARLAESIPELTAIGIVRIERQQLRNGYRYSIWLRNSADLLDLVPADASACRPFAGRTQTIDVTAAVEIVQGDFQVQIRDAVSACIPWNMRARGGSSVVQSSLEAILRYGVVQGRVVDVRVTKDPTLFAFGHRYSIEFASPTDAHESFAFAQIDPLCVAFTCVDSVGVSAPCTGLRLTANADYRTTRAVTETLALRYLVQPTDATARLTYANAATALSGSVLRASALPSVAAVLALPTPALPLLNARRESVAIVRETSIPTVVRVVAATRDGAYTVGDDIVLFVQFSGVVDVSGIPTLELNSNGVATYFSGTRTDTLEFRYKVAAGDAAARLNYATTHALVLSTATNAHIRYSADVNNENAQSALLDANIDLPNLATAASLAASHNLHIDSAVPRVLSVSALNPDSIASTAGYGVGDVLLLTVTFSDEVIVVGSQPPMLQLDASATATATFTTHSYRQLLDVGVHATRPIVSGQFAVQYGTAQSGCIDYSDANSAAATSMRLRLLEIDAIRAIGLVSVTLRAVKNGHRFEIVFAMAPATPVIPLALTPFVSDVCAPLQPALESPEKLVAVATDTIVTFWYDVKAGDASAELDFRGTSLVLPAADTQILRRARTPTLAADVTLPLAGSSGRLRANKHLVIVGTAVTVVDIVALSTPGTYGVASPLSASPLTVAPGEILFYVEFTRPVRVVGLPRVELATGSLQPNGIYLPNRYATFVNQPQPHQVAFLYRVLEGDSSADLSVVSVHALATALIYGISTTSTTLANCVLPRVTISAIPAIRIDPNAVPTTVQVSSSHRDGTFGAGEAIAIQVTFSKPVVVQTGLNTNMDWHARFPASITFKGEIYVLWTEWPSLHTRTASFLYLAVFSSTTLERISTAAAPVEMNRVPNSFIERGSLVVWKDALFAAWDEDGLIFCATYNGVAATIAWTLIPNMGTNRNMAMPANAPFLLVHNQLLVLLWREVAIVPNDDPSSSSSSSRDVGQIRIAVRNEDRDARLWIFHDGDRVDSGLNRNAAHDARDPSAIVFQNTMFVTWCEARSVSDEIYDVVVVRRNIVNRDRSTWTFLEALASTAQSPFAFVSSFQPRFAVRRRGFEDAALLLTWHRDTADANATEVVTAVVADGSWSAASTLRDSVPYALRGGTLHAFDTKPTSVQQLEIVTCGNALFGVWLQDDNVLPTHLTTVRVATLEPTADVFRGWAALGDSLNHNDAFDVLDATLVCSSPANAAVGLFWTEFDGLSTKLRFRHSTAMQLSHTGDSEWHQVPAGSPLLTLSTNTMPPGVARFADLSGVATTKLTFVYVIAQGESAVDLDVTSANAFALNGAAIRDLLGQRPDTTLFPRVTDRRALSFNNEIHVDTTAPIVVDVTAATPSGEYGIGQQLLLQIVFSTDVSVFAPSPTSVPVLYLRSDELHFLDERVNPALYVSGSGSSVLTFEYIVTDRDYCERLDYFSASSLELLGDARIQRNATTPTTAARLTLPPTRSQHSLSGNRAIALKLTAPRVVQITSTSPDGTYHPGDTLTLHVAFSLPVVVFGAPVLRLETSRSGAVAVYTNGNTTTTLAFVYTVAMGDTTAQMDVVDDRNGNVQLDYVKALELVQRARILRLATHPTTPAVVTLPAPGTLGSLSQSSTLAIDSVRPRIIDVRSPSIDGTYDIDDTIDVLVEFSRRVVVVGTPELVLNVQHTSVSDRTAAYMSGSGTAVLRFVYSPHKGDATPLNTPLDIKDVDAFIVRPLLGGREVTVARARVLCRADVPTLGADLTLPRPGAPQQINSPRSLVGNSKKLFVRTDGFRIVDLRTDLPSGETYSPGQRIRLLVVFTGPVIVQGALRLQLNAAATNAASVFASYTQGSGTNVLTFEYIVASGDVCSVLDAASRTALVLNGGIITDTSGMYVPLRLAAAFAPGSLSFHTRIAIATAPPIVTRVFATSGTFGVGDDVRITVTFSRRVTFVSGLLTPLAAPTLVLQLDAGVRAATYTSGDGSHELLFTLRIQAGDATQHLEYVSQAALTGTLYALATTSIVQVQTQLPLPTVSPLSLSQQAAIRVDSTPPRVLHVTAIARDGTYGLGDRVQLCVSFSYRVVLSPSALATDCSLELTLGNSGVRTATYVSGSGSNDFVFVFTVALGDRTGRLDYAASTSLRCSLLQFSALPSLVAATVLPLPGSTGSLSDTSDVRIDATAPRITSVSSLLANGVYGAGQVVDITVAFSEAVTFTLGQLRLRLTVNRADSTARGADGMYVSGAGTSTLLFRYTTRDGDMALPLAYNSVDALTIEPPTQRIVAAANTYRIASLRLPVPTTSGSLSNTRDIRIDTSESPRVVSVGSLTPDGVYTTGDNILISVTFTTPVVVTGAPTLALAVGAAQAGVALYVHGSGTSTLVFAYAIERGDHADRLDYRRCPDSERRDPLARAWSKLVVCSATSNALQLGAGGTIKRLATTPVTDAVLDLPEVSSWPSVRVHTSRDEFVYLDQVDSTTDAADVMDQTSVPAPQPREQSVWRNPHSVSVVHTSSSIIVRSTGVPDGAFGPFPNIYNRHRVQKQNYVFALPRQPVAQPKAMALPRDTPVGVMLNGVPFFASRSDIYGLDVMSSASRALRLFDKCNGLVDAGGDYRYYASPDCFLQELGDVRNQPSPLIGFALDGFPLYGPTNEDGVVPTDLDACNGRVGGDGTYRYHVTMTSPYLIGCFRGRPSNSGASPSLLPETLYRSLSYSHSLRIDTTLPHVQQVYSSKSTGHTFVAGETLDIVVRWSAPVVVNTLNGLPTVAVANSTHVARFDASRSSSRETVFLYTVSGSDNGPFSFDYRTSIQLNGATIQRLAATPMIDADVRLVHAEHTPGFASKHQLVQSVKVALRGLYHPHAPDLSVRLFHDTQSAVVFAGCCAPTDAFGSPDTALRVNRKQQQAFPANPTSGVGLDYSFADVVGATNLAADGRATALQSSTSGACFASNAIDSRIDGFVATQTVARTDAKQQQTSWWELRLVETLEVGTIRVWLAHEDRLPAAVQRLRVDSSDSVAVVDGSFTLVFTTPDGSQQMTDAISYNAVAMINDENAKIANNGIGHGESVEAKLLALHGMSRVFITRSPADASLSPRGAFTWLITFLDNPKLYASEGALPLRVGHNAICSGAGEIELTSPLPGDDADRWHYSERDDRADSAATGKRSMYPFWIMLFDDTATMDFESFRDSYDAAIYRHRVAQQQPQQQRRVVTINPPPHTRARYVRVVAERPFTRLTLTEVQMFRERIHVLSAYTSGTPVSPLFFPGAEPWSPEEPFDATFGSLTSEGTWTLAIQDLFVKQKKVGERITHGDGGISDWVLTITDMAGNTHTYYMDVRAQIKTLPRHGKLYVGIDATEADHLDSDRNGLLDATEASVYLDRFLPQYDTLPTLRRKRLLLAFMADVETFRGIEVLHDASERQKRLPIACDDRCLADIGMDPFVDRRTSTGDVGLKLMDVVGDRVVKYVPDPGFVGQDTVTFTISIGTTESDVRGTVELDVRACGNADCSMERKMQDRRNYYSKR